MRGKRQGIVVYDYDWRGVGDDDKGLHAATGILVGIALSFVFWVIFIGGCSLLF